MKLKWLRLCIEYTSTDTTTVIKYGCQTNSLLSPALMQRLYYLNFSQIFMFFNFYHLALSGLFFCLRKDNFITLIPGFEVKSFGFRDLVTICFSLISQQPNVALTRNLTQCIGDKRGTPRKNIPSPCPK